MSTSDPTQAPAPSSAGAQVPDIDVAQALARELQRLANEIFSGGVTPESPPTLAPPPAVVSPPVVSPSPTLAPISPAGAESDAARMGPIPGAVTDPRGPIVPPRFGPSALSPGAGGISTALTAPPIPGPIKQPPLAVAPPPKETDLRVVPTILSEGLGISSPVTLAGGPEALATQPYFLEIAGVRAPVPSGPGASSLPLDVSSVGVAIPASLPRSPSVPTESELPPVSALSSGRAGMPPSAIDGGAVASEPYFLALRQPPGVASNVPSSLGTSWAGLPSEAVTPEVTPSASPMSPNLASPGAWPSSSGAFGVPELSELLPPSGVSEGGLASGGTRPEPRPTYDFQPELAPVEAAPPRLVDGNVVKKDFPILGERIHGRPIVWLDNAATTQKPQVVIDRLSYYYEHENSNVHRAAHTLAARATDAYEGARETVRRFLNAPSAQDIVFVRGATEAINLVAKSWGRRNVGRGDEIVITWLEHHANIVPWQQLCAETGACLRVAPVDSRGQVILEEFDRLLGTKTRLVSFSQVSNALGTIVPARELIEMAHRHGAVVMVDGAQAVSHMSVDVQALDCDFYCFSGHKVFAPTGIGVLYGKRDILNAMPPWQGGGNMIADVTFEKTTYQLPPWRFEAGTGSIADAVGLGAAIDYVSHLGLENVSRYEHELLVYATQGLSRVPGLRIIGTAQEKAGVISFVLDGFRTEDVGRALDQEGIAVRAGHHCAQPILRRFGLESTVRASLAPYNTMRGHRCPRIGSSPASDRPAAAADRRRRMTNWRPPRR